MDEDEDMLAWEETLIRKGQGQFVQEEAGLLKQSMIEDFSSKFFRLFLGYFSLILQLLEQSLRLGSIPHLWTFTLPFKDKSRIWKKRVQIMKGNSPKLNQSHSTASRQSKK